MTLALKQPRSELNSAARAIDSMMKAESFEAFESEWREFLSCLEKAWTKTERACQPYRDRFQPWQGKFQALRKKDMLLRYLKQARDADNHSIQEITILNPGSTSMRLANPQGGYVKSLKIENGKIVQYEGDDAIFTITAPLPEAQPVKNNGEWSNPPTLHLGKPVSDKHPITLATLGLAFYLDFVEAVEKEFFPT